MKIYSAAISDFNFILRANAEISGVSNQAEIDKASQARLKNDLFGAYPRCHAIMAEADGVPIGMALYSTCYFANEGQIMWVSQIYVLPEYRRHIATGLLMRRLNEIALENGWPYICSGVDKDNAAMGQTLIRAGAKSLENFHLYSVKAKNSVNVS